MIGFLIGKWFEERSSSSRVWRDVSNCTSDKITFEFGAFGTILKNVEPCFCNGGTPCWPPGDKICEAKCLKIIKIIWINK